MAANDWRITNIASVFKMVVKLWSMYRPLSLLMHEFLKKGQLTILIEMGWQQTGLMSFFDNYTKFLKYKNTSNRTGISKVFYVVQNGEPLHKCDYAS